MKRGITLLTMGAGNIKVLRKTLESFNHVCDEIIYGDLLLFPDDRNTLWKYKKDFNMRIVPFKFDYLFKHGFSVLLNELASYATNDMVLYMNTSEIIEIDYGITEIVNNNPDCNTFFFTHKTDPHRWFRMHNRHELQWSGRIHEQLKGEYRPYHKPIFRMADLPKDMDNEFKARCLDSTKEIVYFTNYMAIIDKPESLGETDAGWMKFAADNYDSFKLRLEKKGKGYEAFLNGDLEAFMQYAYSNLEFRTQQFESNIGIEYQNDPAFLGKR